MGALTNEQKEKIENLGFTIKFDNSEKSRTDSLDYSSGQTLLTLKRNGTHYFVDVDGEVIWVNPETGEVYTTIPRAEGIEIKDVKEWINNNWFELLEGNGSVEGIIFHDLSQLPKMLLEFVR